MLFLLAICLALAGNSVAGTRGIAFIHQPFHLLGTEADSEVLVARVPILVNSVPEAVISAVCWPNKLPGGDDAQVPDSNILSCLGIKVSAELVKDKHYTITLDLREMRPTDPYGVTVEDVVAATVRCLRATFDEDASLGSYKLSIQTKKDDKTDWSKHEGRYETKKKRVKR